MVESVYLLPAYNYRVTIMSLSESPVVSFSEVSGLTVSYEAVTYKHGMSFLMGSKIIPGMRQPINVTLKRGLAKNRQFLSDWFSSANLELISLTRKRDIIIDLCDANGTAAIRWIVQQALPTKIEFQGFEANNNEVAIETLELIAHDLQVNYQP